MVRGAEVVEDPDEDGLDLLGVERRGGSRGGRGDLAVELGLGDLGGFDDLDGLGGGLGVGLGLRLGLRLDARPARRTRSAARRREAAGRRSRGVARGVATISSTGASASTGAASLSASGLGDDLRLRLGLRDLDEPLPALCASTSTSASSVAIASAVIVTFVPQPEGSSSTVPRARSPSQTTVVSASSRVMRISPNSPRWRARVLTSLISAHSSGGDFTRVRCARGSGIGIRCSPPATAIPASASRLQGLSRAEVRLSERAKFPGDLPDVRAAALHPLFTPPYVARAAPSAGAGEPSSKPCQTSQLGVVRAPKSKFAFAAVIVQPRGPRGRLRGDQDRRSPARRSRRRPRASRRTATSTSSSRRPSRSTPATA